MKYFFGVAVVFFGLLFSTCSNSLKYENVEKIEDELLSSIENNLNIKRNEFDNNVMRLEAIDSFIIYNYYDAAVHLTKDCETYGIDDTINVFVTCFLEYQNQDVEFNYSYNQDVVSLLEENDTDNSYYLTFLLLEDNITDIGLEINDYKIVKKEPIDCQCWDPAKKKDELDIRLFL